MDDHEMTFELQLSVSADRKQVRSLGCAAAVCLRDLLCREADILWPGRIMLRDDCIARAEWASRDGELLLRITVTAPYAGEHLPAALRATLEKKAAAFPANNAEIIQEYANNCRTIMKYVDTVYRGMPVYGFAFAVDKYGGLMVMTQASRTVITVYGGTAELAVDEPQQPEYPAMPHV